MKLLIFAFVIACVLQDYGTMQQGREASPSAERVEQLKKYAVELISAAIPVLRGNQVLLEGGCECSLATDEHLSPIDAVWSIMEIAKDYPEDIEAIKNASDVSSLKIKDGLAEHIRKILVVLGTPPDDLDTLPMQKVVEKYVLHLSKRDSNEPYLKCALMVLSFYYDKNYNFTWGLYRGLEIVSAQLRANVADPKKDARWNELKTIIEGLPKCSWNTPASKYTKEAYELISKWLNGEIVDSDQSA